MFLTYTKLYPHAPKFLQPLISTVATFGLELQCHCKKAFGTTPISPIDKRKSWKLMLTEEVMPLIVVSRANGRETGTEVPMSMQVSFCMYNLYFTKRKPITKFRIIQLGKGKLNYNSHKYFRLSHQFYWFLVRLYKGKLSKNIYTLHKHTCFWDMTESRSSLPSLDLIVTVLSYSSNHW